MIRCSLGVSAHHAQLEARYAFRTRVLDYLWAGLPIVLTEGDATADLVQSERLGVVVAPDDIDAWEGAFRRLAESPSLRAQIRRRVLKVRERYRWSEVGAALESALDWAITRPTRPVKSRRSTRQSGRYLRSGGWLFLVSGVRRATRYLRSRHGGSVQGSDGL